MSILNTIKGNCVYDPFMGTGSTAVVAKKMNRRFLGSEISSEYMKVAEERIKNVGSELFLLG